MEYFSVMTKATLMTLLLVNQETLSNGDSIEVKLFCELFPAFHYFFISLLKAREMNCTQLRGGTDTTSDSTDYLEEAQTQHQTALIT